MSAVSSGLLRLPRPPRPERQVPPCPEGHGPHLKRIYAKLEVSSRAETVERARLLGLP